MFDQIYSIWLEQQYQRAREIGHGRSTWGAVLQLQDGGWWWGSWEEGRVGAALPACTPLPPCKWELIKTALDTLKLSYATVNPITDSNTSTCEIALGLRTMILCDELIFKRLNAWSGVWSVKGGKKREREEVEILSLWWSKCWTAAIKQRGKTMYARLIN